MPIAGDVLRREPGLRHAVAHGRDRRRPDFLQIVLDLAGRGIDLRAVRVARVASGASAASNAIARVEVVP